MLSVPRNNERQCNAPPLPKPAYGGEYRFTLRDTYSGDVVSIVVTGASPRDALVRARQVLAVAESMLASETIAFYHMRRRRRPSA